MYPLENEALQNVFRFFGHQAAAYYEKHKVLPPACILVWVSAETNEIKALHQFPTEQVSELLSGEEGKLKLATAIQAILNPKLSTPDMPAGPRPDLVLQIVLAQVTKAEELTDDEAIIMLAHAKEVTVAVSMLVAGRTGTVSVPNEFELEEGRLDRYVPVPGFTA
jgi:hypothetical protein